MSSFVSRVLLLLCWVSGIVRSRDAADFQAGFEFIYHESHDLLLTVYGDACYFSTIDHEQKPLMNFPETRNQIEEKVKEVIISQNQTFLFHTSLPDMRDEYADLLANYHCASRDVYDLDLFPPVKVTCGFESGYKPHCNFTQENADDFDWTKQSGPTPSGHTGPMADHRNGTGTYMYTECSEPIGPNYKARLVSQPFNNPDGSVYCLRFFYHMFGSNMGTLNVYVPTQPSAALPPPLVWSQSGDKGDQWRQAQIEITPSEDFKVVFEGICGHSYLSDIAIDDVTVSRESCKPPIKCNFDLWPDTMCGFTHDNSTVFNWTRQSGRTASSDTGPTADHTYGANGTLPGHYMYIESGEPRQPNETARLVKNVPSSVDGSQRCLRFFYHMYGVDIGTLNVYAVNQNSPAVSGLPPPIWTASGNQGDVWKDASVTIPFTTDYQLFFEGVIGPNYRPAGDTAIDDITISEGKCSHDTTTTVNPANTTTGAPVTTEVPYVLVTTESTTLEPTTTTTTTSERPTSNHAGPVSPCEVDLLALFKCCFEDDEYKGGWCDIRRGTQGSNGNYWTRHQGATPTDYTGPAFDHSLGPNQHGHYLYIQSSGHYNVWTNLHTPRFDAQRDTRYCLKFHYHMYGHDINELHVHIDTTTNTPVWSKSGNQGNAWKEAVLDFTHNGPFEIIFEGHTGRGPQGDAAIDDVFLYHGPCSSVPH